MDSSDFTSRIEDMQDFFGKRLKDASEQYYKELQNIPNRAWVEICAGWMRSHKPQPGNFPSIDELSQEHHKWLDNHPSEKENADWEFCPYCESVSPGLIKVRIPFKTPIWPNPEKNYRNTLILCGHCNNYRHRNPTWPRLQRSWIADRGWECVTPIRERDEEDEDIRVPRATTERDPGMVHIEKSLPVGDREDEQLPF